MPLHLLLVVILGSYFFFFVGVGLSRFSCGKGNLALNHSLSRSNCGEGRVYFGQAAASPNRTLPSSQLLGLVAGRPRVSCACRSSEESTSTPNSRAASDCDTKQWSRAAWIAEVTVEEAGQGAVGSAIRVYNLQVTGYDVVNFQSECR